MSRLWKAWFVRLVGIALVACTDPITQPQTPVQLAFTAQPSNATAGVVINPVIAVAIQDASGNTVTSATNDVTMTIEMSASGGWLAGTATVAAVNGIASFANLRIVTAGTGYTLRALSTRLTAATSTPFDITAGRATTLRFTRQPSNAVGGDIITPPVEVTAQDSVGNRATGFGDNVTVGLGGNSTPGTLSGTTVVSAVNGVATFSDLSIAQTNTGYTLIASAGTITDVTSGPFSIVKPTATLRFTAVTSGDVLDPDGYAVCVDAASDDHGGTSCAYGGPFPVGENGIGTVTVDIGAHAVLLTGVAANCTVAGDNPRAVSATRGETAVVPFAITCVDPTLHTLHVTTTTTGVSFDPDGTYSLCFDPVPDPWDFGFYCSSSVGIGVNGALILHVTPGGHSVSLEGVPLNCVVSGSERVVDSTDTEMLFAVTCVAAGSIRVTTATSGTDVELNGYQVCVDGSGSRCAWVPATNDVVTLRGVIAGSHTVTISILSENCSVSGGTARAVTVPQDGTVDVAFEVRCIPAERIAFSSEGTIAVIRANGWARQSIAAGLAPAWSPDGTRLAYECGLDICAINADGTGFARLTLTEAANHHPTWSSDGLKIAFAAAPSGVPSLYVMAATGSGAVRLAQGVGFRGSPAWSPDGTRIAFDCVVDAGNKDICVVNADATGFARLTSDTAGDYGAAWKPDGSTLAFTTTRYGSAEIVFMGPAGGSPTRAGLSGFHPTWSPDGTQLAFEQQIVTTCCGWDFDCDICPYTSEAIFIANADGSAVRYLTAGYQPAWKPQR